MEWIETKVRLPKTDDKYRTIPVIIAMNVAHDWENDVVGCFYSELNLFHTDEGLQYDNITHWMVMPKHPNKF